jgi:uncharacterized protein involved in outer membrane biogenesis
MLMKVPERDPHYLEQVEKARDARRRMHLWMKIAVGIVVLILLLLIVAVLWGPALIQSLVGSRASSALGRDFSIEKTHISWDWTTPHVELTGIRLGNIPKGSEPAMVGIEKLDFHIRMWKLLLGQINLPDITITKPRILLEKLDENTKNWDFPVFSQANVVKAAVIPTDRGNFPYIGTVMVRDGTLIYRDAPHKITMNLAIDVAEGNGGDDAGQGVRLSGSGTLQEKKFELDAKGGSIAMLRGISKDPFPLNLHIVMGDTKVNVEGTFTDPVKLKGIDAKLDISGHKMSDLFYLTNIPLPPTPPYSLSGTIKEANDIWTFNNFKGRVGDSDLSGDLSYDTSGKRGFVKADLSSNKLDMADLSGFIGEPPSDKPGKTAAPEQKAAARAKAASSRLLPDVPINLTRLRATDMDVQLKAKRLNAPGWPIENMLVRFDLKDGLLKLDPLQFGVANGKVEGSLILDGRKDVPRVESDLVLKRLSLKQFFENAHFKQLSSGQFGGRFKITGYGKSLADVMADSDGRVILMMAGGSVSELLVDAAGLDFGKATIALLGKDKSTAIRCAIGDFGVKDGALTSDIFAFDTTISNVEGRARINLKNETIDASVEAHPKEATLAASGTPITVTGKLKNPSIGISPEALAARGGAAAALTAFLTPLAGLIPFIELGLGEDSDCRGLLNQAKARANAVK